MHWNIAAEINQGAEINIVVPFIKERGRGENVFLPKEKKIKKNKN